jgi:hypothetical protein
LILSEFTKKAREPVPRLDFSLFFSFFTEFSHYFYNSLSDNLPNFAKIICLGMAGIFRFYRHARPSRSPAPAKNCIGSMGPAKSGQTGKFSNSRSEYSTQNPF